MSQPNRGRRCCSFRRAASPGWIATPRRWTTWTRSALRQALDEANRWLRRVEASDRSRADNAIILAGAQHTLAMAMIVTGEPTGAPSLRTASLRGLPSNNYRPVVQATMGFAYAASGDIEMARRILAGVRLDAPGSAWSGGLARLLAADAAAPTVEGGRKGQVSS
jgi:hypothetical protein